MIATFEKPTEKSIENRSTIHEHFTSYSLTNSRVFIFLISNQATRKKQRKIGKLKQSPSTHNSIPINSQSKV